VRLFDHVQEALRVTNRFTTRHAFLHVWLPVLLAAGFVLYWLLR
jgi:hypothetical protein